MRIGLLTIHILLPGCASLKEKRGRLKPLIHRIHKEFNVSVAEIAHNDVWKNALIGCAMVSNNHRHIHKSLSNIVLWVEKYWQDVQIIDEDIELI